MDEEEFAHETENFRNNFVRKSPQANLNLEENSNGL
jgi:hypothetical protein